MGAQAHPAELAGDYAGALSLFEQQPSPNPWQRSYLLVMNDRSEEALTLLRKLAPELFEPAPALKSPWAGDSILVGTALVQSGATEEGKRLLQQSLRTYSGRRRNATVFELGWWDVYAHSLLGDLDQACAALEQGVAEGYFLNLPTLGHPSVPRKVAHAPLLPAADDVGARQGRGPGRSSTQRRLALAARSHPGVDPCQRGHAPAVLVATVREEAFRIGDRALAAAVAPESRPRRRGVAAPRHTDRRANARDGSR